MYLLSIFLLSWHLFADCKESQDSFCEVEYIKNYDGDTASFNIKNLHPLMGKNISVRFKNIDTAEIRTKDKCEKKKAIEAKELIREQLTKAKIINLKECERGKYFRLVCEVVADRINLSEMLIKKDLTYSYKGKTKRAMNWCKRLPADQ